jgi:hypothetical protein
MVATRGRTFKRPWRRSCLSSKLKSSSAPIGRKDSWCFHAVGSSNAPLLGSTAAEGLPRIGRTSIATRWRSCGLPQSASCSENFVIPPDVFGQTLRVSQRKLDPQRSIEYLPYYPHDERQLLEPGEIYEVDLEIWPMGLALPAGSRLTLTIQGKEFERPGATGPLRGVAWFTHDDPTDRPSELFAGTNWIYTGGPYQSYLLLPMLPSR